MATQMINLRLGEKLIDAVDNMVKKTTYSSRTEFIREAVRKQVEEENRKEALAMLKANFGKGKGKVRSNADYERVRNETAKELFSKKGIKL